LKLLLTSNLLVIPICNPDNCMVRIAIDAIVITRPISPH